MSVCVGRRAPHREGSTDQWTFISRRSTRARLQFVIDNVLLSSLRVCHVPCSLCLLTVPSPSVSAVRSRGILLVVAWSGRSLRKGPDCVCIFCVAQSVMFGSCWNVTKCTGRPHTHGSSACRVATGVLFTTSDEARIQVLKGALRLTHQRHVENTPRSNLARALKARIKRPLEGFHKTQMHTGHGRAIHQQTRLSIRRTSSDDQTESRTRAIVLQYISHVAMCHALQI